VIFYRGVPKNKQIGGDMRGKCYACGLPTTLNIHNECGIKKTHKMKSHDIPERQCINLDCLKTYKPTRGMQKFCPECVAARKRRSLARKTQFMCHL